jgi:hypothetical protein
MSWSGTASQVWAPDAAERGDTRTPAEGWGPSAARTALPARLVRHGNGEEVVVLHREPAVVGSVTRCTLRIPPGVTWVGLRVADHRRGYGAPAPRSHPCASWAVAYASPWYLSPRAA